MHILLIARHYPPEISGGARRPSLYVKALRSLGHRVTLVTPFAVVDQDSITIKNSAISRGREALQSAAISTSSQTLISRTKACLRIWAYWPDDNIHWVNDVIKAIKGQDINPDWILTTSPPESIHIAGAKLSKHFGVPWVAELRDTWVEVPHRRILAESNLRAFLERRIAKKVLGSANAVTAVSEAVMSEARKYVSPGTPECIITHFSDPPPTPYKFDGGKLNLVHTGGFALSDRRRTLPHLLQGLDEIHLSRPNLVFHIAGPLSADEIDMIENAQTPIEWHGSVSLTAARAMQAGADGLVLYTPSNSHALPGKYAEYALTGRPILYLGGGDWLKLVDETQKLRPLVPGGVALQKNETITMETVHSHINSAKILVAFLAAVQ